MFQATASEDSLDADRLIAERAQNTITSRDGSGLLLVRGGRSNDTIVVTEANDVYVLGLGDTAVELPGEGNDTVQLVWTSLAATKPKT
jgi:hypothetical protein